MKKRKKFTGFGTVYKYTLGNHMKSKKFLISTILVAFIIIAGIMALIILTSKPKKDKEFKLTKVYVSDETGLGVPDYAAYVKAYENEDLKNVVFETAEDGRKLAENAKDEMDDFILIFQTETEDNFVIELVDGRKSTSDDKSDLSILGDAVKMYFRYYIYEHSGLTGEELVQLLMPVVSDVSKIGEEENGGKVIVEIISVFGAMMCVYFMIMFYGIGICSEVSIEKTSKLTEQILVSVSPEALVSGKILGAITASIVQFLIWVVSIVVGLFGGSFAAELIHDLKQSRVRFYMDTLGEWFENSGFSVPAIILAILLLIMGLVFYLVLAGLAGSFVTKPEEASNVQTIFFLPMIISFFVVLPAITSGEGSIALIYNMIPFTAAMSAPGTVLIGNLSIAAACISLLIMIVCAVLFLILAARIYKGLLFFNGEKLTPKIIWGIIKGK